MALPRFLLARDAAVFNNAAPNTTVEPLLAWWLGTAFCA